MFIVFTGYWRVHKGAEQNRGKADEDEEKAELFETCADSFCHERQFVTAPAQFHHTSHAENTYSASEMLSKYPK